MKAIRIILASIRTADQKYNLFQHGDKIVLGLSGGKDSVALLYALSLYQKFSHTDFTVQPVTLDLGFPGFNPEHIKEFVKSLGYELIVSDSKEVYKILLANQGDHAHLPCSICSKMKKAAINKVAIELGFNKVAFAHHADDAIETFFMNQIYGAKLATFSPKMHLERADITFIRPFINVREKDIIRLIKEENLPIFVSSCPADKFTTREDIKSLLKNIYKQFPNAYNNYLTMLDNYEHSDLWGKETQYQINQDGLTLKPAITAELKTKVIDIRNQVFLKEQGISIDDEYVMKEENLAKHFLIYKNETPIGTIRYLKTIEGIKIQRFAILKEYRNNHYGKQAFNFFVEMLGKRFNPVKIYFDAQYQLLDYYASIGFTIEDEPFIEANIKHIKMYKNY